MLTVLSPHMLLTKAPVLRSWLAAAGLGLSVFATVALSGPGRFDNVDGQTRYEVARSLVDHGDHVIRNPSVWFGVFPGRDGQPYTYYRFPQSFLGVPATFGETRTVFETHVLDGALGELYGRRMTVEFLSRLRGPLRFPSVDALRAQIELDVRAARRRLRLRRGGGNAHPLPGR